MTRSTVLEIPQIPPMITPIARLITVAIIEIRIELRGDMRKLSYLNLIRNRKII